MLHESPDFPVDDAQTFRDTVRQLLRSAKWIIPVSLLVGLAVGVYAATRPKIYTSTAIISTGMLETGMLSSTVIDDVLKTMPASALPLDRRRAILIEDISMVRARNQSSWPGDPTILTVSVSRPDPVQAKAILDELIKTWAKILTPVGTSKQKLDTKIAELRQDLDTVNAVIKKYETEPVSQGAGQVVAALYPMRFKMAADLAAFIDQADGVSADEIIISNSTTPDFGRDRYPFAGPFATILTAILLFALSAAASAVRGIRIPLPGQPATTPAGKSNTA